MHNIIGVDTFTDPFQAIDDTDPPNASNFDTPIQALANRTKFLRNRLGMGAIGAGGRFYRNTAILTNPHDGPPTTQDTLVTLTVTNAWVDMTIGINVFGQLGFPVVATDEFELEFNFNYLSGGTFTVAHFSIWRSINGGAGPFTEIPAAYTQLGHNVSNEPQPVTVRGYDIIPALGGNNGQYRVELFASVTSSSLPATLSIQKGYMGIAKWWGVFT